MSQHLLAPPSPSKASSQQPKGSPSSPDITGGFNCPCISNNSALGNARMPEHPLVTIPNQFSLLNTIPSLRLTESEVELSVSLSSHHHQQPLVSHLHALDPHPSHPHPRASEPCTLHNASESHTSHPCPNESELHISHSCPCASDLCTSYPYPHALDSCTSHSHPNASDPCTSHPHPPTNLDFPITASPPQPKVSLPICQHLWPVSVQPSLDLLELRDANSPPTNLDPTNLDPSQRLSAQASINEVPCGPDPDHTEGKPKPKPRIIYINSPSRTNDKGEFSGNKVRTSKYTWLTFLPKNLFEQFRRVAYIYFLVIVALNQIPLLAVFGRTASLFPLLFVLIITAIKDGYEDWGRHRSDIVQNNRIAQVFSQGEFRPKKWKKIKVGEVVKVDANTPVPCDIVLLAASDPTGVAYIQTLNLDGESNLKTRYAMQETQVKEPGINPLYGVIVCEPPTRNIYEFSANLEVDAAEISIGASNVILRGCELKNTSWIVGVVVYAGKDTKVMMNSLGARSKRSKLESQMNSATMWLAFFLFIICLVGGVGMGLWVAKHQSKLDSLVYYRKRDLSTGENVEFYQAAGEAVIAFLSFIIMFQVMIPISLYISMELVRLGQSTLMSRDKEMYHDGSDTPLECRALNINEDLGQIKYIFSDKTGTLTQNKMEFNTASIGGISYNEAVAYYSAGGGLSEDLTKKDGCRHLRPKHRVKVDLKLLQVLQSSQQTSEKKAVHEFFLVLAVCNTVVPIRVDEEKPVDLEASESCHLIEYQGESPDEQALVTAAASYGFVLLERTSRYVKVEVQGELLRYDMLGNHEFDSERKRMSVVVRCPDTSVKVLLKGADTAVLDLVTKFAGNSEAEIGCPEILSSTKAHLDQYAKKGLRTLVVAFKSLSEAEFLEWDHRYASASKALNNRVVLLRRVAETLEKDLTLLGATGVEDKLQDGVPETIATLRAAGMKVWMLTGDKQETAISIGFSCSLLAHDMEQIVIKATSEHDCREKIREGYQKLKFSTERQTRYLSRNCSNKSSDFMQPSPGTLASSRHADGGRSPEYTKSSPSVALIIDGNSLVHALDKELEQELFDLASACQVVICCRVAPSQKANVVSLIKDKAEEMTLAIGDGANDVPMLQKAHVGVGISGQEGRQAVMSSDFSMGQFRFLRKLLLVHGHWNYQRLSYMVLYNFYRNAVFVMMLFWYILQTAFSPSFAIFDWNLMFYSLIYTSVPTIVIGILDKDVGQDTLLKYPPLYGYGQRNENYNSLLFWITMLDTLWQSSVLFYVPFFAYQVSTVDIWSIGSLWTISVVILVNLHLAMDVKWWTWITHLAIWGSIISTFCCLFILDAVRQESSLSHYGVIFKMIKSASYWYNILLIVIVALLPRFIIKFVVERTWPSDVQIAREIKIRLSPEPG